jgi:uncharacterized protein YxeA
MDKKKIIILVVTVVIIAAIGYAFFKSPKDDKDKKGMSAFSCRIKYNAAKKQDFFKANGMTYEEYKVAVCDKFNEDGTLVTNTEA